MGQCIQWGAVMALFQQSFSPLRKRQPVPDLGRAITELEEWFDTPFGQRLLNEEQKVLDDELSCLFGYHLMQLSINRKVQLYEGSRICHCFSVGAGTPSEGAQVGAYSALDELPFEDESVDVTVLHHVLEFSNNPHQVLKEASRVTIARGYIIVIGFNPFGLMGLLKPFAQMFSNSPIWQRNSLRQARVADWLQFLDCNTVRTRVGCYGLPWQTHSYLQHTQGLNRLLQRWRFPMGNFYCLVARKDRVCMTPLRPEWQRSPRLRVASKQALSTRSAPRLVVVKDSKSSPSSK